MAPHYGDNDDGDDVDVHDFINTGGRQGSYMPTLDQEEPFRARDDQTDHPKKRRLDYGFSQETPPAADQTNKPAGIVFSPNTLRQTVGEQIKSPVEGPATKKKQRKRSKQTNKQPPKRIRAQDDVVPGRKDGLLRVHVAGQPILSKELQNLARGSMMSLHDSIKILEQLLLNDRDPNYPVFTVKVPADVHFVHEAPADLFFIAYEDIFNLFHSRRLDYNLVRLYALHQAMRIKRENTSNIAIVDPYYMRDCQLVEGSGERTMATTYLQKFLVDNKRKDVILLPFFPE
jgi:hypothetical protein